MADTSRGPANFWTQADALFRKNLNYQKRNRRQNCSLISFPIVFLLLIAEGQHLINNKNKRSNNNNHNCNGDGKCEQACGSSYKDFDQTSGCPIPSPPQWLPLLQIPVPENRAVRSDFIPFLDLPDPSCRRAESCPVTVLTTGNNRSLVLGRNLFPSSVALNDPSNITDNLANFVLGTQMDLGSDIFLDPAFTEANPLYYVQRDCASSSTFSVSSPISAIPHQNKVRCVEGLNLWRNTSCEINEELYKGYKEGNAYGKFNEILAAYDFLNSNGSIFNVSVWYNITFEDNALPRVPRLVNLVSNAYLQFLNGFHTKMLFDFVKEMPRPASATTDIPDITFTGVFYTWVILLLFPVFVKSLVYEKQQKLRIMMKMHGLGDGPYWMISYIFFLYISSIYMLVLVIFGSLLGLKFFTSNDYSIQFVFYFLYINLLISMAFLSAVFFSHVMTATVVGYIFCIGTGLVGVFFQNLIEGSSFSRGWLIVMELFPGFSLSRGLYEFSEYASRGSEVGMQWGNLNDSENGMKAVLVIMLVEWLMALFVAYYMDQALSSESGKSPLFFLRNFGEKRPSSFHKPSVQRQDSKVFVNMDKPDISEEREKVERALLGPITTHAVVCDDLQKVYPGRDGNPKKMAVKGLSLALPQGECFGMLGPNGAGKTSFINMMIGLTKPTSGTAYVRGLDLQTQMDWIYTSMGVCPQHDLLWETLTGREHLLFYGRLKNLKGSALEKAVEESLKSVKLFNGGVADKQTGKYSGGMKRRLSVAISLIGDPKVVYMDEPSSGLDPASRTNLWNAVKHAKQTRAIILTTHSMEEAEALCDRVGVFVDGSFGCIGTPRELKARFGGSYEFTITTTSDHEQQVVNMVQQLSPSARRTYHTSGTQKFEIPKHEARIAAIFRAVENAGSRFPVFAWGLSDTTLEDVFNKVANGP